MEPMVDGSPSQTSPRVIDTLAESRVIRRAAQITAYALTRAQIAGRDASERFLGSSGTVGRQVDHGDPMDTVGSRFRRLRETFVKELKEGWRDASRQSKK
ncbi:hypothetical protein CRUP_037698 [Coryphaenoides rupestris]|nr:hypothetical protein CRUP_037698 [Coryphaenoides rupestris]